VRSQDFLWLVLSEYSTSDFQDQCVTLNVFVVYSFLVHSLKKCQFKLCMLCICNLSFNLFSISAFEFTSPVHRNGVGVNAAGFFEWRSNARFPVIDDHIGDIVFGVVSPVVGEIGFGNCELRGQKMLCSERSSDNYTVEQCMIAIR
jgi:hypothetical protein